MFSAIFAVDDNFGFGKSGSLPWYCEQDLKYFSQTTRNSVLIMGRKTWESIPQQIILKNRDCIVITTSNTTPTMDGLFISRTVSDALQLGKVVANNRNVFVIGGVSVLREVIANECVDRISITTIHGTHPCDTFFNDVYEHISNYKLLDTTYMSDCTIRSYIKQPCS